jgi:hypothetical protein
VQDAMAPLTGGTGYGASVPSLDPKRRRSMQPQVPERAVIPSHERDIFGWWYDAPQEAKNKLSAIPSSIMEWFNPRPDDVDLQDYLRIVGQKLVPIAGQQFMQGNKQGSALGPGASFMGVRPAPPYLQDPEGYARGEANRKVLAERRKTAFQRRQQSRYGGPQE